MNGFRPIATFLIIISLCAMGCGQSPYKHTAFLMGTTVEFTIVPDGKNLEEVKGACIRAQSRISQLDSLLSLFDGSSEVARLNADVNKTVVKASSELCLLVKRAKEYAMITDGAFDITVGALTEAWGFGQSTRKPPSHSDVSEALRHVGLNAVGIDEEKRTLYFADPKIRFDFGGFAKGYAVDEAIKEFRASGIENGIVNIGGDLYCMGINIRKRPWTVGIRDPENKRKMAAKLYLTNKAIATSGNYENFYIDQGKRYAHIIDPRSGSTVSNAIRSVTVIADDCATADALATAVFVLGEDNGLKLIEQLADIECVLVVEKDGVRQLVTSSGIKEYLI